MTVGRTMNSSGGSPAKGTTMPRVKTAERISHCTSSGSEAGLRRSAARTPPVTISRTAPGRAACHRWVSGEARPERAGAASEFHGASRFPVLGSWNRAKTRASPLKSLIRHLAASRGDRAVLAVMASPRAGIRAGSFARNGWYQGVRSCPTRIVGGGMVAIVFPPHRVAHDEHVQEQGD